MKICKTKIHLWACSLVVFSLCSLICFFSVIYLDPSKKFKNKKFIETIDTEIKKNIPHSLIQSVIHSLKNEKLFQTLKSNTSRTQHVLSTISTRMSVNYNVHAFYYPWYGTPKHDGKFYHWDHPYLPHWDKKEAAKWPKGHHTPPDDIGANFYPKLGPYSSSDPSVIENHMQQIQSAGAGVLSISWYPPHDADTEGKQPDSLVNIILNTAARYGLKVNFHIEPFKNRNQDTLKKNIVYIIDKYGDHPAFYRHYDKIKKKHMPVFYIYDSYLTKASDWAKLFKSDGSITIRNTKYDGLFIGLLVERQHKDDIYSAGFDGFYTYFASDGFTYGSAWRNWRELMKYARNRNLLFIPSVGPGYIDTRVRPWNDGNTKSRSGGKYYQSSFQNALDVNPAIISITSFNEWHEGTQIETAIPKNTTSFTYLDYGSNGPTHYLNLTRKYVSIFEKKS